jgi:hypothetical protein
MKLSVVGGDHHLRWTAGTTPRIHLRHIRMRAP